MRVEDATIAELTAVRYQTRLADADPAFVADPDRQLLQPAEPGFIRREDHRKV
jgi:hypothetical protein